MTDEDKKDEIKILRHIAVNIGYVAGIIDRIIRKQKRKRSRNTNNHKTN